MAGAAAAAAAAATIISGAAAKLQSWPKSARAGSAQNPGAGAATVGSASLSPAPRTRLPRMKGAAASGVWEEELERREEGEEVEKEAGVVPVPVAAMMDGSAWRSSHSMVWPSDLACGRARG
ncbi:hypothetical protein BAE44_0023559 [Dichanthelium oligosanthes]|uniref:Uncharacterized protein n=1 Tax=Dichanthelium oligosanthes TaxID=888268 RepID=A0A1E5URC1_9POAL|nr:hypothetical protein BAE44_0023559 [Dichanthelium oligosanthes]